MIPAEETREDDRGWVCVALGVREVGRTIGMEVRVQLRWILHSASSDVVVGGGKERGKTLSWQLGRCGRGVT